MQIHGEQDILNTLGYYFAKTHRINDALGTRANNEHVYNKLTNYKDNTDNNPVTTFSTEQKAFQPSTQTESFTDMTETKNTFKNTNNKKSAGLDAIPNIVLKHLPENIVREYCTLFNNIINNAYYPKDWKTAKVIAIPKKDKNKLSPTSYRPISLAPNISKAFEKIILEKISSFSKSKALIPDQQFGFREGHSTTHALSRLASDICWHKNNNKGVGALLIDTEKAFDTVWLNGLLVKLIKYEFPHNIIQLLDDMLKGKQFIVSDNKNNHSQLFNIDNGLQQGTVLAPILFALYTSDLLKNPLFQEPGNGIIGYADDLILYKSGTNVREMTRQMQTMVGEVSRFFNEWKQKINPSKCELILFREPLRTGPPNFIRHWKEFKVIIGQTQINTSPSVKYLGVHLDDKSNYNQHAKKALIKTRKTFFALNKIFYSRFIDCRVKTICYQTLLRPVLTYGCQIWFHVEPSVMENLRRFERRVLRLCLGTLRTINSGNIKYISNREMYSKFNFPKVDNYMFKLIRDHIARTSRSVENTHISGPLLTADETYIQSCLLSGSIPPEAFIYLDSQGYIQNDESIPILYHTPREYLKKQIRFDPLNTNNTNYNTYQKGIYQTEQK